MITTEIKDKILEIIVDLSPVTTIEYTPISKQLGIDAYEVEAVLNEFVKEDLIQIVQFGSLRARIKRIATADTLLIRGGFAARDLLFINNLEKLELEIADLKKHSSSPEKYAALTTIFLGLKEFSNLWIP